MKMTADELMEKEWEIWEKHGWQSGNDIDRNRDMYMEEVREMLGGVDKINKKVLDQLTANNWHSLRNAIEIIQG